MKKFYIYLLMALGAVAALSGCKDDEPYPANPNTMNIVEGYAEFDAVGGQDTVTVNSTPVSVTIADNASWLTASVSGNTVTLTAAENHDHQSRNALVTIVNANGDQTEINASQEGLVFYRFDDHAKFDDASTPVSLPLKSSFPVTILSKPDWIESVSFENENIIATPSENTTGHIRTGWVKYQYVDTVDSKAVDIIDSIAVKQFEFDKDIAGTYYLVGYSLKGELQATLVDLLRYGSGYYMVFTYFNAVRNVNWVLQMQFDDETAELDYYAGIPIGTYQRGFYNYYVVSCAYALLENTRRVSNVYPNGLTGDFYYDDEYACQEVDFVDNGSWQTYVANGMCLALYMSYNSSTNTFVGWMGTVLIYIYPSLLKYYTDDASISEEAALNVVEESYKMNHVDLDIPVAIAEYDDMDME